MQELEKESADPLHGLRVHSWVLVLAGKREVPETFFIDPLTALSYSPQDGHFLGIESIWNHRNYWVNMQDCWNGCKVQAGPGSAAGRGWAGRARSVAPRRFLGLSPHPGHGRGTL